MIKWLICVRNYCLIPAVNDDVVVVDTHRANLDLLRSLKQQ